MKNDAIDKVVGELIATAVRCEEINHVMVVLVSQLGEVACAGTLQDDDFRRLLDDLRASYANAKANIAYVHRDTGDIVDEIPKTN